MARWITGLLVLAGLALSAYAVLQAAGEIVGLYGAVLTDPMGEPAVPEEDRSRRILTALAPAAVGLLLVLVGAGIGWRSRLVRARGLARP